ncbi:MAG: lysoplasmalogenase, partial [Anaerolineae bacterium]|nr:lysoplasmalogenase [Anaerolineae bacterium]NIN95408.1 lysoplasmalogenase [Anaerolineae bacterium]
FKPLTTFLILLMALVSPGATTSLYRGAIVLGLAFSLVGDVFLMLPSDRFLLGLISFLLAHMAYIGAFSLGLPFQITPGYLIPLLVYAILMFSILQP